MRTPTKVIGALAATSAILAGSAGAATITTDRGPAERTCFPRALWGDQNSGRLAPAGSRPCYLISRPAEDASGYLHIGPRRNLTRVTCSIPNYREESRRFEIRCHKGPR